MTEAPLHILKQYWGYDQFRPMQADIIDSVLSGTDTLALLPTGGGKSVCFQVPALCKPGICIVVSPLIALMKDQVEQLHRRGINAAAVYSGMRHSDIDRIFDNCVYGDIKFLYLSPERLGTELARERIQRMNVNLLAVDEAHCISQWGYDFRPPYLEIAAIRELLPKCPVIALTATATPEVVTDIQEKLQFTKGRVFQQSFARNNLAYVVRHEEGKPRKLVDILKKVGGSGVVYVRNRRKTKELALLLRKSGISADYYHAGLSSLERSEKQDSWIHDKIRVMVSTNAFGMGIDKPNVRVVVHMDLPDSLEAYFQEAGRGGRDGKKAYAVLLYNEADKTSLEDNLFYAFPSMEEIRQVYRALGSYYQLAIGAGKEESYDFDLIAFTGTYQLDARKTLSCLKVLEQAGWLTISEGVFLPATLRVNVSKDELYDYQLRNPKLDRILKVILRTYQGAFSNDIHIREGQLAQFLQMPSGELSKALQLMHHDGIIIYHPQKDQPQLFFVEERIDPANLTIDLQQYRFRQQQHTKRVKAAIAYAERTECRSKQLLAYFGEKDAPDCGVCDVCIDRKKKTAAPAVMEQYQQAIQQRLMRGPATFEELMQSLSPAANEQDLLNLVAFLLDEGIISMHGEQLAWK